MEKFGEIKEAYEKEEARLDTEYAAAEAEAEKVATELESLFPMKVVNVQRNACRACNRKRRRRGKRRGCRAVRLSKKRCQRAQGFFDSLVCVQ